MLQPTEAAPAVTERAIVASARRSWPYLGTDDLGSSLLQNFPTPDSKSLAQGFGKWGGARTMKGVFGS